MIYFNDLKTKSQILEQTHKPGYRMYPLVAQNLYDDYAGSSEGVGKLTYKTEETPKDVQAASKHGWMEYLIVNKDGSLEYWYFVDLNNLWKVNCLKWTELDERHRVCIVNTIEEKFMVMPAHKVFETLAKGKFMRLCQRKIDRTKENKHLNRSLGLIGQYVFNPETQHGDYSKTRLTKTDVWRVCLSERMCRRTFMSRKWDLDRTIDEVEDEDYRWALMKLRDMGA